MKIQKRIGINLDKPGFSCPVKVVQYDTGIQLIFTISNFEIPDGTTVTVFFLKPSGKFVYQEKNITISGNEITVDVENQAFTEMGMVEYQVALTNGDDLITSFSRIVQVEKSLADAGAEESKTVIRSFDTLTAEKIADIQAAALDEIAAAKQAIETRAEEVLATIPADYTEMGNNVDYLFNQVANAIKNNVSGSVVAVNDVSPINHKPVVTVHGKNLIDVSKVEVQEESNIYISAVGEGYIDITTAAGYVSNGHRQTYIKLKDLCPQMKPNRYYVLSADTESTLEMAHLRDVDYFLYFGTPVFITEEMLESYLAFYGLDTRNDSTGGTCRISNIQFEEGETVTEYTPYIDPAIVTVRKSGKNIYKVTAKTQTANGVTFTVNNDGSVTVNGTAEKTTFVGLGTLNVKAGEKYYLSGSPSGSAFDTYMLYIHNNTTGGDIYDLGNGKVFDGKDGDQGLVIVVYAGNTVNNLTFYPMVVYGSEKGIFEPYTGAEYIPETDGSIEGITSVSPNMTIFANTAGIIVDCEYNVDTKKYIDNSKSTGVRLTDTVTGKVYELKIRDGHVIAEGVS